MPSLLRVRRVLKIAARAATGALALSLAVAPHGALRASARANATAQQLSPRWDDASKSALQAALADRVRHGLDNIAFLDTQNGTSDEAYSLTALRYAQALAIGLVDPTKIHEPFTLERAKAELEPGLAKALTDGRLDEWLAGLAPQDAEYARLSLTYRDLKAVPDAVNWVNIEPGVLKVGDVDPRMATIIGRLFAGGYLTAQVSGNPSAFTAPIGDAVEALQRDHGIVADRVIGPETLAVLNQRPSDRARAIAVALERRRWLDRTPPPTRIDVNTATAQLFYYRDNVLVDSRRVVVGKAGTETPLLQSPIYRLVANPTWTVPKSIQNGELANADADYFAAHNMELRDGWIVQKAGPDNALGLVKFDMQNMHAIYLHDTSAPELFDHSQRHRSHGCVRVEDALGFAQMLAEDQGVGEAWAMAQISGEQQFVPLKTAIPVRLMYRNIFVDDAGRIAFRTDPYGWNAPIEKALGFANHADPVARTDAIDIAP